MGSIAGLRLCAMGSWRETTSPRIDIEVQMAVESGFLLLYDVLALDNAPIHPVGRTLLPKIGCGAIFEYFYGCFQHELQNGIRLSWFGIFLCND